MPRLPPVTTAIWSLSRMVPSSRPSARHGDRGRTQLQKRRPPAQVLDDLLVRRRRYPRPVAEVVRGQRELRRDGGLPLRLALALEDRQVALAVHQLHLNLQGPARLHEAAVLDVAHLAQGDDAVAEVVGQA